VASWKEAGRNRGRHGSRRIIFGKVALAMFSKSSEATPDRLAHIAATLSQGLSETYGRIPKPLSQISDKHTLSETVWGQRAYRRGRENGTDTDE
jgi:hypothetical protein